MLEVLPWIATAILAVALVIVTAKLVKTRRERDKLVKGELIPVGVAFSAITDAFRYSWGACLSRLEEACQFCFLASKKVGDNRVILDYYMAHIAAQDIGGYLDLNSPDGNRVINACFRSYLPSSPLRKAGKKLFDQCPKLPPS